MKEALADIVSKYFGSFDSTEHGYSRRKISGWLIVWLTVYIETRWINAHWIDCSASDLLQIIGANFLFVLTCYGLTTWQAIQSKKIDSGNNQTTEPKEPQP